MNSSEKILHVMDIIRHYSEISPKDDELVIPESKFMRDDLDTEEVATIIRKLQREQRCLTVRVWPGEVPNFAEEVEEYIAKQKSGDVELGKRIKNRLELEFEPEYNYYIYPFPVFADVYESYKRSAVESVAVRLEPKNYDAASSVLMLSGQPVQISMQQSRRGSNETFEARLMRLLFKDVNTMGNGIPMRLVIPVRSDDFSSKNRKLVKNHAAAINKKVSQKLGNEKSARLIICDKLTVRVNSRYL